MRNVLIISIIIIVAIIIGNIITQNYTKQVVEDMSKELKSLKQKLLDSEVNWEECKKDIEGIEENWHKKYQKLAYFIEHDELEKVETNFVELKSYTETEQNSDAISELDKSVFILKHIRDKNKMELKNIF